MESKNVLIAIVLSTLVLVIWATFFEPPITKQPSNENKITQTQKNEGPSVEVKEFNTETTRDEAINKVNRIKVENRNIQGSISLQGGVIDDIIFKNYKEKLNSENKVTFLNPKNSSKEYFIETGWAVAGDQKVSLPLDNTIWKVKGNNVLSPNNPILIEWNNNEGLIFTKKIELDEEFLFRITQEIKN